MRKNLIHVLGSNIENHNESTLMFFDSIIAKKIPNQNYFYVVSNSKSGLKNKKFSRLKVKFFNGRLSVAFKIFCDSFDKKIIFFFHGQFNPFIWLLFFLRLISPSRCHWYIWGRDLYERDSNKKISYVLYRKLIKKLFTRFEYVYGLSTDCDFFKEHYNDLVKSKVIFFPTPLPPENIQPSKLDGDFNVLIGNSGDPGNNHFEALELLRKFSNNEMYINLMLNYPADAPHYKRIESYARKLFGDDKVRSFRKYMSYSEYLSVLSRMDVGIFCHDKQQAVGTISILGLYGKTIYMKKANSVYRDFSVFNINLNSVENIDTMEFDDFKNGCSRRNGEDIVNFFSPHVCIKWLPVLKNINIQTL